MTWAPVRPTRFGLGALITGATMGLALLSRFWTPEDPARLHIALRLRRPLAAGLLGTDALGRDILSNLMGGAWTSLAIALPAVLAGLVVGTAAGLLAAAGGGWRREAVLRLADVVFAFPALLTALIAATLLGPGATTATLAIGIFCIPVFARLSYGAALRIWAQDFCLAATLAGKTRLGITRDHVLPGIAGLLAVQTSVQLGFAILIEAGLGYLGLSVAPPTPSWGRMLGDAQTFLGPAPWMALAPGAAIATAVLGFNLLGDGLRDRFDPRSRLER